LGPLTSVTYDEPGGPYPITTAIRSDGARTSLTYPSGITVSETRDDGGRLTKVAISGASLWEVTSFAGAELPAVVRRGAVITETSAYDARKRLLSRRYAGDVGVLLEDVRVVYDGADNVTARQLLAGGGRADLFEYDDANRLIRAEYGVRPRSASVRSGTGLVGGPGLSAGVHARTYAYDGGGLDLLLAATVVNPDGVPDQATSAMPLNLPSFAGSLGSHDGFLFASTVDGFTRRTDALGNTARTRLLVRPSVGATQLVAADLAYNGAGNLVRITRADGVTIEMQYRPDKILHHRKVTVGTESSETALVWHEGRLLEEYGLAGGNRVLRGRYYYANGDPPVAADLRQADGSLLRVHYLHDHAMSVVAVANEAGEVLERVRYDAWGQPVLLMRDTTPAAISQIRQDGNSLLVTLSEPVLQVPDQAPGKDLVTSVPGTLAETFELTVNGTVLKPQVVFEEGLAPFGSVFRLSGFPPNTVGAMTVRVVGGKLVDTFGTLVADTRMPFGLSPVPATGVPVGSTTSVGSRSALGNPWLWQGQWFDYDAGLVYMRARHYDPQTGHFLQRDPMQYEDSVNLYAAMANNPVSYRDPTGMGLGSSGTSRSAGRGARSARTASGEINLNALRRSLGEGEEAGEVFADAASYRGKPGPIDRNSKAWKEATQITDSELTGVHRRHAIQPDEFGPTAAGYKKVWQKKVRNKDMEDEWTVVPEGTEGAVEWKFRSNEQQLTHGHGYKLHITSSAEDALIVSRTVDQVLDSMGIHGKVVRSEAKYASMAVKDIGNKQQGKFWTVYIGAESRTDAAAKATLDKFVRRLDQELGHLGDFGGISPGPRPQRRVGDDWTGDEIQYGKSGFIFGEWNDNFYK